MKFIESETLELKTSTAELDEAVISITAILNKHQKGELYFGIKNSGEVVGQEVSDKTLRDISFLKEHMRVSAKIEGLFRKEKWEIPIEALREAIINSLIHRDYYSSGFIYIKIYDDKIVIANPGKLPQQLSLNDLYGKHESIPKNPLLADVFYYTGLIDVWGRGISNILNSLKKNGLEKPKFEESGGYFRVIFSRPQIEKDNDNLNAPVNAPVKLIEVQKSIITEILKNNMATYDELASIIQRDRATVMRNISKLKEKGLLRRVGPDKGGHWEIINKKGDEK